MGVTTTYLVCVQSPKFKLFFEEGSTYVGRVVQLAGPVIVEDLGEDTRMPVEEVLVKHRVVVGQRLSQSRQPCGRNLLEGGLVSLEADTTDVEYDAVVAVDHSPAGLVHGQQYISWLTTLLLQQEKQGSLAPFMHQVGVSFFFWKSTKLLSCDYKFCRAATCI